MSAPGITAAVARFVHQTDGTAIPAAARQAARRAITDTVGVALAGAQEPCVRIVRAVTCGDKVTLGDLHGGAPGAATLLGAPGRVSALDAALINGTAAHVLDYDDTHASIRGHPSAPIVAAALAAAELTGASGAQLVDGYLLGLEVAARVGRGLGPSHAAQGFHATGTLGVLGAAVAASRLLGLDERQVAAALGVAASSASGLRINFGTMTKPLHSGNAARAGLMAALLAGRGFSAAGDLLDPETGFTAVFSPGDGEPCAVAGIGAGWQALSPGIAVKKYPCCNRGHRAADAILHLVRAHDIRPGDVMRIEVRMPPGQVDRLGRIGPMIHPRPADGLQAKFSMQYVIAAAVFDGDLRIATFTDDAVRRPAVQDLLTRVQPVEQLDPGPDDDFVEVAVWLHGGRRLSARVRYARGDPRGGQPLSDAELAAKYRDCAGVVLLPAQVERSLRLLRRLDELDAVATLTAELTAEQATEQTTERSRPSAPRLRGTGNTQ